MRNITIIITFLFIVGILAGCTGMLPFGNEDSIEKETIGIDENVERALAVEVVSTAVKATKECSEVELERLTKHLGTGFYIPSCATLQVFHKGDQHVEASLIVRNGDWKAEYESYRDFLGENVTEEELDFDLESAVFYADLNNDDKEDTRVIVRHSNEEGVVIEIIHYFSV